MVDPVPPFRIVIPCVQVYLFILAVCCFLLGLDYSETSFLNGFVMPITAFALWGGIPGWVSIVLMKLHFTIPRAHYSAILWTLPAAYLPLVAAIYFLCQPMTPFIMLYVFLIGLAYIILLALWYWVAYLLIRNYYKRNPWAAY